MKHFALIIALVALLPVASASARSPEASSPTALAFQGGDGRSVDSAIVIIGAKSEAEGVRAESTWLKNKLPGHKTQSQSLLIKGEHMYDKLKVSLPDGTSREVYFDITSFFGKL